MTVRVVSGRRFRVMCVGGSLLVWATLLVTGFVFVRSSRRGRFNPDAPDITYPVEPWLLQTAAVLAAPGAVLALVAYFSSPKWTLGARAGSAWPWFDTALIAVMGASVTGASIATFVAAPGSPERTTVLVVGCIVGGLLIVGSLLRAPTSQELERYRTPPDTPIEAVE